MTKIKIVTDSTVDLSNEELKKFDIEVVPLTISMNGQSFKDRVDITPSEFMEIMKKTEELPKTSQPSAGAFLEVYDRLGAEGYDIISIHLTGSMSGTVQSAESAANMTEANVTVIDSRFISKALSFQVLEAAKMVRGGSSIKEIVERLAEIRLHTRLYVVVDTLENLVKGGRIGKGKAFLGSLLNIKPILSLEDGELTPVTKVRSYAQVIKYLTKQFEENVTNKVIKEVGFVHADGYELALKIKEAVQEKTGYEAMNIDETTPVISAHTGAGTVGFMYYFE